MYLFIRVRFQNDFFLFHTTTTIYFNIFQHESTTWATSVFSVKDTKPQRLPIVDVAIRDMGNPRKKFKIELGPVCYT